jgi:hypothetical protein
VGNLDIDRMMLSGGISADEKGGNPVQTTGDRRFRRGPVPECLAYVFIFLGSIIAAQINSFRPSPKSLCN